MKLPHRRLILPILALIGFAFAIRTVASGSQEPPIAQPVAAPAKPPFELYVAGAGIVESNSENIAVATPVAGVVTKIFVQLGQQVRAGEPLFQLDDRELQSRLMTRHAALQVSQAELEDAKSQLALWEAVGGRGQGAVSKDDLTRRRNAVQTAAARVVQAQAEVKSIETELDRILIRAPIDAEVLQIKTRLGEFAAAQTLATPLMLLGGTNPLHVRVDVDENDAWRVRPNARGHAFLRGNSAIDVSLEFVRFEPYVIPKRSLTGDSVERVDTRVLQVIYKFQRGDKPIFVGQLMDVYIDAAGTGTGDTPPA